MTPSVKLSYLEILCLQLAANDLSIQQTSEKMCISFYTVKKYRSKVLRKLACRTMTGAITTAIRQGLITLDDSNKQH